MEHSNDCTRHLQTVVLVDALSASTVQSAPLRPINAIDESLQAQPPRPAVDLACWRSPANFAEVRAASASPNLPGVDGSAPCAWRKRFQSAPRSVPLRGVRQTRDNLCVYHASPLRAASWHLAQNLHGFTGDARADPAHGPRHLRPSACRTSGCRPSSGACRTPARAGRTVPTALRTRPGRRHRLRHPGRALYFRSLPARRQSTPAGQPAPGSHDRGWSPPARVAATPQRRCRRCHAHRSLQRLPPRSASETHRGPDTSSGPWRRSA